MSSQADGHSAGPDVSGPVATVRTHLSPGENRVRLQVTLPDGTEVTYLQRLTEYMAPAVSFLQQRNTFEHRDAIEEEREQASARARAQATNTDTPLRRRIAGLE